MKTLLDLMREFADLDEAKAQVMGQLPFDQEKRWSELESFCHGLMSGQKFPTSIHETGISAVATRVRSGARRSVRVPMETSVTILRGRDYDTAGLLDLSQGGALLAVDSELETEEPLTLFLATLGRRGDDALLASESRVVWSATSQAAVDTSYHKVGVRFVSPSTSALQQIDAILLDVLERRFLSLDLQSFDEGFVRREGLVS